MNKFKISLILNIINFICVSFAVIALVTGFHFMSEETTLELAGYNAFQFFTFDSNLLLGIITLVYIVYEILLINNKIDKIPNILSLLKFVSTVAVSLTMLTVLLFLGPTSRYGFLALFMNANLFLHLICPLLAIVSFGLFEKENEIKFRNCIYGIIPTFLYGIYYVINVAIHMDGGVVDVKNDWYGFAQGGPVGMAISVVVMFGASYLIGILVYLLNKKVLIDK